MSPRDKFLQYEAEEKNKLKNFPTARELREAKERAAARLKREQDEAAKIGLTKRLVKETNSRSNKVCTLLSEAVALSLCYA
jgi:DNA-directed RNA polymerase III subunit RPC3